MTAQIFDDGVMRKLTVIFKAVIKDEAVKLPKITKQRLREAAFLALSDRDYVVSFVTGPGIVPGARLKATKDDKVSEFAVRTSLDREVGLLRKTSGDGWRTIPNVTEVVVAVPDAEDASKIEVLGFEPDDLIAVFDEAYAAVKRVKGNSNYNKAPVFVPLDRQIKSAGGKSLPSLKTQRKWRSEISLERFASGNARPLSLQDDLINRFKRDIAELAKVDVEDITIEIHIKK